MKEQRQNLRKTKISRNKQYRWKRVQGSNHKVVKWTRDKNEWMQ